MTHLSILRVATLPLAIAAIAATGSANAATQARALYSNAAGVCQSALPGFDGLIRKRPLAIQNEGATDAFVTCPMTSLGAGSGNPSSVVIWARSNDSAEHVVSCTGVTDYATGTNAYVVKTVTLPASGSQQVMRWQPADFPGSTTTLPSPFISFSCSLPPGTGLNDTYVFFSEDIGT